MLYRIVNSDTQEILFDSMSSYDEAWSVVQQLPNGHSLPLIIEEYKLPVTGLGRDPDLH